ncbi:MAG: FAD-dependent thymidylate synthase [Oscillospiraceae bacterium]|nr:FAD-dependent thymidylate synthase [Oscillospiraceae bacterium]
MRIIPPSCEIIGDIDGPAMVRRIELIGRVCYKSEDKITDTSAAKFIAMILKSGHESVLEHEKITVRVVCDRGVTHEIVRHRLASYSQESTRYCNYSKDKFGGELTFIKPCYLEEGTDTYRIWETAMQDAERSYLAMLEAGAKPEEARAVLPNSLKTELVMTMDIREWRHFFRLRTAMRAHPQMRELAQMILDNFRERIPVLFDDIQPQER